MIPAKYWSPTKKLMLLGAMAGGKAVEDTATGNPLTFLTDLARPLKSLLIPFAPKQTGSGDPSPSNIRPIVPWEGLTVFGGGGNYASDISNRGNMQNTDGVWSNSNTDSKTYLHAVVQFFNGSTNIKNSVDKSIYQSGMQSMTFNVDVPNCNMIVLKHSGSRRDLSLQFPFSGEQGEYTISFNALSTNPSEVGGLKLSTIEMVKGTPTETSVVFPAMGKNLLDESQLADASGITYTGGYYTGTRVSFHTAFSNGLSVLPSFKENTRYTLSATGYNSEATSNTQFVITYTDGTQGIVRFAETEPTRKTITTTNGKTVANISISYGDKSRVVFYVKDIQLEEGTSATAYEPFDNSVYGGTMNLVSGVLTVEYEHVTISSFGGAFGAVTNGYAVYYANSKYTHVGNDADMMKSNAFKYNKNSRQNMPLYSYGGLDGADQTITFVVPSECTSVEDANTWLASLDVPLEVMLKLATPQEIQLTPQQITALKGNNTLWSDADGSMTAVYLKKG